MNYQITSSPPSRPRFKVHSGLQLEAQLSGACITTQLTIDEALSLAMILLYEVREQAALQHSQGSATR